MRPTRSSYGLGVAALFLGSTSFLSSGAHAQCGPAALDVFVTSDDPVAMDNSGDLAAVATGFGGLLLMDISDPADLQLLATYPGSPTCAGVTLQDGIAYVTVGLNQVQTLDVSNPAAPLELDLWWNPTLIQKVIVSDGFAYVATAGAGVKVLDVSNPAAITPLSQSTLLAGQLVTDLFAEGPTLYVAGPGGLSTFDVTSPAAPVLLGSTPMPDALRVSVSRGVAYVLDGFDGLCTYDVANPSSPTLLGTFPAQALASSLRSILVSDHLAFVGTTTAGIAVLDVLDPSSPALLETIPTPGQNIDLALEGGALFGAGAGNDFRSFEVSSCLQPMGAIYCGPAPVSSSGSSARLIGIGSNVVAAGDMQLLGVDLPPGQVALALTSLTQGFVSNPGGGQGELCLGGDIARWNSTLSMSDPFGSVLFPVDLSSIPTNPAQPVLAGQTWNFQVWFRDQNPGFSSNLTDALAVDFQ